MIIFNVRLRYYTLHLFQSVEFVRYIVFVSLCLEKSIVISYHGGMHEGRINIFVRKNNQICRNRIIIRFITIFNSPFRCPPHILLLSLFVASNLHKFSMTIAILCRGNFFQNLIILWFREPFQLYSRNFIKFQPRTI